MISFKILNQMMFLYADDTSILEKISDPNTNFEKINRDLSKLHVWSQQWLVNFNPTKTKYMIFCKKLRKFDYPDLFIGNERIQKVTKHKQLGIIFNDKMTFDTHIEENCKKAMNRLSALQCLGIKIPRKGRLSIYISFIRPILEFGFQLYDSSAKYLLERFERVQRQSLL